MVESSVEGDFVSEGACAPVLYVWCGTFVLAVAVCVKIRQSLQETCS